MDLVGVILAVDSPVMRSTIREFRDACVDMQAQIDDACERHTAEYPIDTQIGVSVETNTGILPDSAPDEILEVSSLQPVSYHSARRNFLYIVSQVNRAIVELSVQHAAARSLCGASPEHRGLVPIIALCNNVLDTDDYLTTVFVFLALMNTFKFIYTRIAASTPLSVMRYVFPEATAEMPTFCMRHIMAFHGTGNGNTLHPIDGVREELKILTAANAFHYPASR
jgi:hypothetical protein